MSLKMKLVSMVSAFILVLSLMLTGVLASQMQTLTMTGSVNFNVADKSLYVKQVRIKHNNGSDPQVVSDFSPGYINGNFDMNIGEHNNSTGSFALYFDIINATDTKWVIAGVELSEQLQAEGVIESHSGTIEVNELTDTDTDGYKNFDPSTTAIDGTLILTITAPNSSSIDLSGITITLEEYSLYNRVDPDGNPDPDGGYILFGYYPQTVKASDVTIVSTEPEANGYYLGSDGEYYMQATAKVNSDDENYAHFKDNTQIIKGDSYYFKVEPLLWRILTENYNDTGNALIVCDTIVDMVPYRSNIANSGDDYCAANEDGTILIDETATPGQGVNENYQVYANNYEYSEIRAYLNNDFYNRAFTAEEQALIMTTAVDNSFESIFGSYADESGFTSETFNCECRNTQDKVFLLSLSDVNNAEYGFKNSYADVYGGATTANTFDTARAYYTSDYSRAMGVMTVTDSTLESAPDAMPKEDFSKYLGSGWCWLRSPQDAIIYRNFAFFINTGYYSAINTSFDSYGALPALQIQL